MNTLPHCMRRGFTLVEILVSASLFAIMAASATLGMMTTFKQAHAQSVYNSVSFLVESELERLRSIPYFVPNSTFLSSSNDADPIVTNKLLKIDKDNSSKTIPVTIQTITVPHFESDAYATSNLVGHMVTVTASYTLGGRTFSLSAETLINQYSGSEV